MQRWENEKKKLKKMALKKIFPYYQKLTLKKIPFPFSIPVFITSIRIVENEACEICRDACK